jgi:acyl-CoA reductase-like NAD-dependent aldehyde dehydrogenase
MTMTATDELPSGLIIDGEVVSDTSAGAMSHINPATGTTQQDFPLAGRQEVDAAVQSARQALRDWRRWTPDERERVIRNLSQLLRDRAADFGVIASRESGLPSMLAPYLAPACAQWIDYYAGWIDKLTGDTIPAGGAFDYTHVEPIGVVAVLLTWNSSVAAYGASVGAALAAGCTVVVKSPELAPFSGSLFGRLCLEAGLPPGVVNVISGGPESGDALVRHPGISKISFTGGPETAKKIQAAAAESLTPLLLELGGKSANIVFADCDIERAATIAAAGMAALNGQTCIAPTRLLVEASRYDEIVDAVVTKLREFKLGDPFDPTTGMGPIISEGAVQRILGIVDRAKSEGAGDLLCGGERLVEGMGGGYFISPAVFGNVDNASALAQEEAFGPVLAALPFDDVEEAIQLANDTRFGLSAYIQTSDLERAHYVAHELDAGTVWVNAPGNPIPGAPFGGVKNSGYGKQGGREGILEFCRVKTVSITLDPSAFQAFGSTVKG